MTSGAVIGLNLSQRLTKRREILINLSDMLKRASILISYSSGDLYELFSENFSGFVFVRDRPFDAQWTEFIKSISDCLKKDDIILLENIINGLGSTDKGSQQRYLDMNTALLEQQAAQAQSDIDTKSKLYRIMPLSLGLFISILII